MLDGRVRGSSGGAMFESLRDDSTSANPVAGSGDSDVNTSGRDPFELQLHASPSVPRGRLRGPPGSRGAHTPLALVNAWAHEHRISPVLFWAVLLGGLAVVISLSLLGSIAASTSHLASASGGGGSGGSGGGGGGGGGGGRPSLANAAFDGAVAGWQPCVSVNGTATATAPGPGSTSFLTLFTNPNATGELLAEISADALGRPFLVSAIYDKGSWVSEAGAAGGGRGGIHASVSGGLAHRLPRPSPPSPPPTPHLLTPLPPPPLRCAIITSYSTCQQSLLFSMSFRWRWRRTGVRAMQVRPWGWQQRRGSTWCESSTSCARTRLGRWPSPARTAHGVAGSPRCLSWHGDTTAPRLPRLPLPRLARCRRPRTSFR